MNNIEIKGKVAGANTVSINGTNFTEEEYLGLKKEVKKLRDEAHKWQEAKKEIENDFEKIQSLEHNLKSSRFLRDRLEKENTKLKELIDNIESVCKDGTGMGLGEVKINILIDRYKSLTQEKGE